ncbi:hypothetical protein [Methylocystis parvus]|uniref:Cysteine rich repeat protein n=1 Tax=Methylocystis parvus TaxID=134 RepID=A0A6B8M656_9HYPH|nr:hypothetical protein [Methylocystis parvus]QGM96823.1 hypothetical protein F7D14_04585 [Methylocystis parvus]WBJ99299.1 hypothetical protein MMG94_15040 [Methylocystis parvus OBBP]
MRQLFLIPLFSALLLYPAMAQGTSKQRAACEKDSHRLCASAEPDALAVENCLKEHIKSLSPACRRQFSGKKR